MHRRQAVLAHELEQRLAMSEEDRVIHDVHGLSLRFDGTRYRGLEVSRRSNTQEGQLKRQSGGNGLEILADLGVKRVIRIPQDRESPELRKCLFQHLQPFL